jgi:large subunit ribosomal protein L37Ae
MSKKIGAAARFGPRYGRKLRKRWLEIEKKEKVLHRCPVCQRLSVKRISTSIWKCKKCDVKFSGGAYLPSTAIGKTVERIVKRENV